MGRQLSLAIVTAFVSTASAADWSTLDRYQQTITRAEFDRLLADVYCPSGVFTNYLTYDTNTVTISSTPAKTNTLFTLHFSPTPAPTLSALRRIALDPGHIGGEWARMEERWFVRGADRPVQEAALNLTVAHLLKPKLEAAGHVVVLTKDNYEPVTAKRPADFRTQAESEIPASTDEANRADAVRQRAELLFYRYAEIAARARKLNDELKPDLTLCLHFNAVEWNDCHDLVDDNRLVIFITGNFLPAEIADDVQKLRLLTKLLEQSHRTELRLAEALAGTLAHATKLPPVEYAGDSVACRVGASPYVYARNLAANRLINGPVVFLEPYYMNNRVVYQRLQLGDYDGEREIAGQRYRSIFREYAAAVAAALTPSPAPPTMPP